MTNELLCQNVSPRSNEPFIVVNYYLISFVGLYILLLAFFLLMITVIMNKYFFLPSFNDLLFFSSLITLFGI